MKRKKKKKLKILVTGSSGFIGKHLIKRLNDYDAMRNSGYYSFNIFKNIKKKIASVDIVIHLGGKTPYSDKLSFLDFLDFNFKSTLKILEFCIRKKVKKMIFVSSYVYGKPTKKIINELHSVKPHSEYTMSKYLSEQLCDFYSRIFGLNVIILRPFNIYGKGQRKGFFIPNIVNAVKTGKKVVVINKKSKRDFLYVGDFVDLIANLIGIDLKNEIFNVGYGRSYSFEDITKKIEKISKKKIHLEYIDNPSTFIPDITSDITKIRKKTGWIPKTLLDEGLKIVLNS